MKMTVEHLQYLCDLLPDTVQWGDPLTPEIVAEIAARFGSQQLAEPEPHEPDLTYLSGPMSGLPDDNVPAFNRAAARLRGDGLTVFNPAELSLGPTATWHDYMRADLRALTYCRRICLLPGWEHSNGAHLELHDAHRLGLDITFYDALTAAGRTHSTLAA